MRFSSPFPTLAFVLTFQTFFSPLGSRLSTTKTNIGRWSKRKLSCASCLKLKHLRGILRLWSLSKTNNITTIRTSNATHGGLWRGVTACCSGILMLLMMYAMSTCIYNYPTKPWGWAAAAVLWWVLGQGLVDNGGGTVLEINIKFIKIKYLNFIPGRLISRYWGSAMNSLPIHRCVRPYLYSSYAWFFGVKLHECVVSDLQHYEYISHFFLRSLQETCRPINHKAKLVSPCDGKVLCAGEVNGDLVKHVKGITYDLASFLGPIPGCHDNGICANLGGKYKEHYREGLLDDPIHNTLHHAVIYLAPGDYHKFHSPTNWSVSHRRHFPGDLLSVHPLVASLVPNLYVLNERVVLTGKWKFGFFSMTAVGATNVGSINLYHDKELVTNRGNYILGEYRDRMYANDVHFANGSSIGEFNLGSTIVLVFEAPKSFTFKYNASGLVEFGEEI